MPKPNYVQQFRARLTEIAAEGASAEQIADHSVAVWRSLDATLSPIIGRGGVAALFKRALSLIRPLHNCLASVDGGALQEGDFAALRVALSRETCASAVAVSCALLEKFVDLLVHLIGRSLTESLLQAPRDDRSS